MKDYKVYQYYTSGYKVLRGVFTNKRNAKAFLSDIRRAQPQSFFDLAL